MSFEEVAQKVRNLAKTPSEKDALELYGLYKQATVGDCNTAQPGAIHVEAKKKWDAWNGRKGMSKDDAKTEYVKVGNEAVTKYGVK
ncbi:unnamed protein product [Dibothriocephalus latus]|uniref:ACB domain-containing protein n=1 Tax=Dibothriocephalus latus TaxID=60516 RepID=A0A3P7MD27_DIBLA|nr:unnamed protein product [Dibothriocephalus latus]